MVKEKIALDLEGLAYSTPSPDPERRHRALLNLACLTIDDVDFRYDLQKGLDMLHESAHLGNTLAQQLLVDLYPASDTAIEPSLRETWLENVIEAGIPRPAYALSGTSGEAIRARAHARQKESSKWDEGGGIERPLMANEGVLQYALINDELELAQTILDKDSALKDKVVDGETPMLLASRHGNLRMTKMLLARGATLNGDAWQRTTPLHWLHRFPEQERTEALRLLKEAGNDLNAWDDNTYGKPAWFNCFSNLPVQGTPLHWAIDAQCPVTLRTLIENGADPLYRLNFGKSAFVYACCLGYAPAIEIFLENEAVRASFTSWVKLQPGTQVFVQPLFWVVTGDRRWNCLMRNGLSWEAKTRRVIELLVKNGAPTDAVMWVVPDQKMSAIFAAAYHDCNPDVLRSGLEFGFGDHLETTWGEATSGGTALFLAITHQNRGQSELLLKHGANVRAVDTAGHDAVLRACEETDGLFYIQKLVEAGASLTETGTRPRAAFMVAVQNGNFKTARWLYDQGFDRDEFYPGTGRESYTTLGLLLRKHTRGSEKRIRFLLSLPDRGGDGFIVLRHHDPDEEFSALHCAIQLTSEDPEEAETTKLIMFLLLQKYNQPHHLDLCQSSTWGSPLSMATTAGNYKVVRTLLEGGASVDTADKQGNTPLDIAYDRYCYPEQNVAFLSVDVADVPKVRRTLDFINVNTAEILSLLEGYGAECITFEWPSWHETDPGYRGLDWVLEKLRVIQQERSEREAKARYEEVMRIAERMKDSAPSEEVLQRAEEMRQSVLSQHEQN
jgi:ankyrin repeat protein